MQKTNIIGAAIAMVDRFAHLDQAEMTKIEDDAGKWYVDTKNQIYDATTGQPIEGKKPSTIKQRFVWLSEQWWFRIMVGLFFTLVALPWARKRAHSADDIEEPGERKRRSSGRTGRYDEDGFDRDGFDRDGYDEDGFDRDGIDADGYDEDGVYVGNDDDDDDFEED